MTPTKAKKPIQRQRVYQQMALSSHGRAGKSGPSIVVASPRWSVAVATVSRANTSLVALDAPITAGRAPPRVVVVIIEVDVVAVLIGPSPAVVAVVVLVLASKHLSDHAAKASATLGGGAAPISSEQVEESFEHDGCPSRRYRAMKVAGRVPFGRWSILPVEKGLAHATGAATCSVSAEGPALLVIRRGLHFLIDV